MIFDSLAPTLRVAAPPRPLGVPSEQDVGRDRTQPGSLDAERPRLHSHAERGNERGQT
jgi:hypothetical protein